MPIYEYRCDNCRHEFETIQKVSETPLLTCPACSEDSLRKKVSAAGFRLKGGGWYETDFKSAKKRNVAGDDGSKNGSDKSSSEKSSADGSASKTGGDSKSSSESKTGGDAKGGTSKAKPSE